MSLKWKEWTVVHCAMFITFTISSLIFNVIILAAYLFIKPINLELYRAISGFFHWSMHAQILIIGTQYSGSQCRVFVDPKVLKDCGKHHGIFLLNHHYEVDWVFAWMMAESQGALNNGKVVAKKMLKYIPTVGWAWALTDTIFLERNWERDSKILKDGVDTLANYKQPVWLLLYPEGTRLNREKLRLGQEFSRKRGLPVYEHHLVPRTKGFAHIMEHLDTDKIEYIYDVTLGIDKTRGAEPKITSLLMGHPVYADIYIRRIQSKNIPKDPEKASEFLHELFKEKDLLMDSYFKSNYKSFTSHLPESEKSKFPEYKPDYVVQRIWPVVNSVTLNILVCVPILYKLGAVVASGSIVQISVAVSMVAAVYFSLKTFIGLTKIKEN